MDIDSLLTLILGGGLVGTIAAAVKGYQSLKGGTRAREREAVADIARWREEADDARAKAIRERDFWHDVAGRFQYQLRNAGLKPDPENPRYIEPDVKP